MTTTTTNNVSDAQLKEPTTTSPKPNGNIRTDDMNESSASTNATTTEKPTINKSDETTIEHAFFFGLSIDDAMNSTENVHELFYNACKYNHLELVKRCVEEKHINVNEPYNNDYPLCIAR